MRRLPYRNIGLGMVLSFTILLAGTSAPAAIDGLEGTSFTLVAGAGHIGTADGNTLYFWGFADGATGRLQYPGPTLIVPEGEPVTVTLVNWLPEPVSLIFPGIDDVTATPTGKRGLLTWEARPGGGTVTYSFTPSRPGTFYYQSGSNLDKHQELGLFGAVIVRPAGFDAAVPAGRTAYGDNTSRFDREYLFLLSDMDDRYHNRAERGQSIDTTTFFPTYWFINGRNAPDTMAGPNVPFLPSQPYDALPRMHPGEKVLMRIVDMGRDLHPFHHHGNHSLIIAVDGMPLTSDPANFTAVGADLAEGAFTVMAVPGRTSDAIYEWTGKDLGWDVYGTDADGLGFVHACTDEVNNETGAAGPDGYADPGADRPYEWCADHGKPFPVAIPGAHELAFGQFYSGSPFLGGAGSLPPGQGGFNPANAFFHMWHSHNEKEMTNNDVFPGGMMTMMVIVPSGVPIP